MTPSSAVPVGAPATESITGQPTLVGAPGAVGPSQPAPIPDLELATLKKNGRVLAVTIGAGVFLLLGAILLLLCFHGGGAPETRPEVEAESNPPAPEPASYPKVLQPLIALSAEDEARVKEATRRGVEYLKRTQSENGSWAYNNGHQSGATALAALTLLECGVTPDDPAVLKATLYLRDAAPKLTRTYEIALAILFFNRLANEQDTRMVRSLALRLAAGQNAGGGWGYVCPILTAQQSDDLDRILRRLSESKRGSLGATRSSLQASAPKQFKVLAVLETIKKGNEAAFHAGGGDNSNTQFALLALWTARRHEVPVDPSLSLVARRFRAIQQADGSFPYASAKGVPAQDKKGTPSMTCAGLLGLAVGFGIKEKGTAPPPLQDAAVKKALQSVAKIIGEPRKDPKGKPPRMQALYTLWSIERVAVLYQLKEIEGKHWYQWGMDILLANQQPTGEWGNPKKSGPNTVDTSFALLFLQRVNLAGDLTDKLKDFASGLGPNPFLARDDDE